MVILEHCEGSDCLATRPAGWWHDGANFSRGGGQVYLGPCGCPCPLCGAAKDQSETLVPRLGGATTPRGLRGNETEGISPQWAKGTLGGDGPRGPKGMTGTGGPRGPRIVFGEDPAMVDVINAARRANGVDPLPRDFPVRMTFPEEKTGVGSPHDVALSLARCDHRRTQGFTLLDCDLLRWCADCGSICVGTGAWRETEGVRYAREVLGGLK